MAYNKNVDWGFSDFKTEIKRGLSGGYLFCGSEAYLRDNAIILARKAVLGDSDDTFNHIKIDASESTDIDWEAMICELPMFADYRLIEVHGFDTAHEKKEQIDNLLEGLSNLESNSQTIFIFVQTPYEMEVESYASKIGKSKGRYYGLDQYLKPFVFARETPATLVKWISAHFAHNGIKISRETAEHLVEKSGNDMYILSGEISKISCKILSDGRNEVTMDDIGLIASSTTFMEDFALSNAINDFNYKKVMQVYSDSVFHKVDSTILFASIAKEFTQMKTVIMLDSAGKSIDEISKDTGIHKFVVSKKLNAAKKIGEQRLDRILESCSDTDYKLKSFGADKYVLISSLICKIFN